MRRASVELTRLLIPLGVVLALVLFALGSAGASAGVAKGLKIRHVPKPHLPSASSGCEGTARTKNGATTIQMKVDRAWNLVEPFVNVCLDGHGPYPLILDTGAEISVISTELAEEIGLEKVGKPGTIGGAGCTGRSQKFRLPRWSLDGIPLQGGAITTTDAPEQGPGFPRGSLGADVLSRFAAARLDFARQQLTVRGKEGPIFKAGAKSRSLKRLVRRKPALSAPMKVKALSGGVQQSVEVGVGEIPPRDYLIDTGAALTFVDSKVVRKAKLEPTGVATRGGTYCSTITVPEYRGRHLKLGNGRLEPQRIGSLKGLHGGGVLGASSLARYGSVVFDWTRERLQLGVG